MNFYVHSFGTRWGMMFAGATERGLALLTLPGEDESDFGQRLEALFASHEIREGGHVNKEVERQLRAYFSGTLKAFSLPLEIKASTFQAKVLKRVSQIPYGKTMTYGEVAASVGAPGAARAVGTANACNNIPIVIPCHRVVSSTGIGGYGGGIDLKQRLLELEGAVL